MERTRIDGDAAGRLRMEATASCLSAAEEKDAATRCMIFDEIGEMEALEGFIRVLCSRSVDIHIYIYIEGER